MGSSIMSLFGVTVGDPDMDGIAASINVLDVQNARRVRFTRDWGLDMIPRKTGSFRSGVISAASPRETLLIHLSQPPKLSMLLSQSPRPFRKLRRYPSLFPMSLQKTVRGIIRRLSQNRRAPMQRIERRIVKNVYGSCGFLC